jgi:muconolactone delta-isomerase
MSTVQSSPQLGRIARLLGVAADDVQGLDGVPDGELRELHDLIGHAIFADQQANFVRVAGLSKVLPGAVAGKLAERFLPPTLAARIAEHLEPAKARELVGKVSVGYLADLTIALDPTRSAPVVRAIPARNVAPVARELFGRGEYAAMAEFAGTVTLEALFAALEVATARDLLTVVPLLEWNDNIDRVVAEIPPAKVDALIGEIVDKQMWDEGSYLIEHLGPEKAGNLVGKVSDESLAALALGLDPLRAGPVVHAVPVDRVAAVARTLFAQREYEAMARFVGTVEVDALFAAFDVATARDLLAVVPLLEWTADIEQVIDELGTERLDELLHEVAAAQLWTEANTLIERLTPAQRERVMTRVRDVSDELFAAFRAAAADEQLSGAALEMLQQAESRRTA